jgi:hypothetical protein
MATGVFPAPAGDVTFQDGEILERSSSPAYSSHNASRDYSMDSSSVGNDKMNDIEYGTGGKKEYPPIKNSSGYASKSNRKSQYYSDMFALREPPNLQRERVTRDSIVAAEVRTNVIVSI